MKKFTIILLSIAIAGFSTKAFAQIKKHILFEHFTNAGCIPCAAQNPIFDTAILVKHFSYVKHCEYHADWPGTDPMNAYNASDVAARVSYYGVTGVPNIKMSGNKYSGSPVNVTVKMTQDAASVPSPLQVKVRESSNGISRNVKVTVYTLSPLPAGSYKVRTAVAESVKNYTSAPGTNGEKIFKDVFRKMLPNTSGDNFTPATTSGDSIIFTYNYNLDLVNWDTTKIYTMAWVQEETSKEVINCGSSLDPLPKWKVVCPDEPIKTSVPLGISNFAPTLYNLGNTSLNFRIKLIKFQPSNWMVNFTEGSTPITDSIDINIAQGNSVSLALEVTSGATPAIGEYYVTITDLGDPTTLPLKFTYLVNSGITDLIINNDVAWGNGLTIYSTETFQGNYIKGLNYANETSFAVTKLNVFTSLTKFNKIGDIKHLYFNVGWSFPSFTIESTTAFKSVLDNGGNMFVSGQDIGWDTWANSTSSNGNSTTQFFYTNYLKATWKNDGSTANNNIKAISSDPIFGAVTTSNLVNVYGNAYFYPDRINPTSTGRAIFYYKNNADSVGAVRSNISTFKTVYLGFSLEQLSDTNVSKMIIKQSHDWFHNLISSAEFDLAMKQEQLGQNYPNPADNSTSINLSDISENMILKVSDITGRVIIEQNVAKGTTMLVLNTSPLSEGIYLYSLLNENKLIGSKLMQVAR